ncbi:PREDICTED: pentatricopeptide repeat-containing protein PNM1, mitochondrial [Nelumbo nucifera]|uniref:Pentatricopeptide repeat-containing protein PNM1, mitochondrial n=1 Tax=Nelumbo nucifera TaxID=4432 RepID=A0A1U8A2N4_NELNU|nr:PREDICTED: pentatricopeptide repeat-containing protein PNM1, mitochondrial [Nelumbo nucifera]
MWRRPPSPSATLQLRQFLRGLCSSVKAHDLSHSLPPSPVLVQSSFSSLQYHRHPSTPPSHPLFPSSRAFSSRPRFRGKDVQNLEQIAQSISEELLKDANAESISLKQRLHLHFSHIRPTPELILQVLNRSPDAGRSVLDFHQWVSSQPGFKHDDETFSYLVDYLGRRKDFKAIHDVLVDGRGVTGRKTLASSIDRLVRAGRDTQAVAFFEKMEKDYNFVRDRESLKMVVSALCEHGYAGSAEKMVKNLAHEFFPDESICDLLIKGWCSDGKLDEARRLAGEMYRGGFELGVMAYNSILDCVCKLCRRKDPFSLQSEAEKILMDMDVAGVPRNVETFNVLISNLCKIRKTEDALKLFERMGEWGCYPDSTTFLVLTRSVYQAARIGEGDEMIDRMKSAGFGDALDKKAYYGFLKILCGIERVEHAMKVFARMKKDGCQPGIKTYDLLMEKLCAHGQVDRANALYREATKRGLPMTPKVYKLDPRFAKKKPKVKRSEKPKRETLPEKMARKRRRLRKLRLSFVKKPKRMMRRAF